MAHIIGVESGWIIAWRMPPSSRKSCPAAYRAHTEGVAWPPPRWRTLSGLFGASPELRIQGNNPLREGPTTPLGGGRLAPQQRGRRAAGSIRHTASRGSAWASVRHHAQKAAAAVPRVPDHPHQSPGTVPTQPLANCCKQIHRKFPRALKVEGLEDDNCRTTNQAPKT